MFFALPKVGADPRAGHVGVDLRDHLRGDGAVRLGGCNGGKVEWWKKSWGNLRETMGKP